VVNYLVNNSVIFYKGDNLPVCVYLCRWHGRQVHRKGRRLTIDLVHGRDCNSRNGAEKSYAGISETLEEEARGWANMIKISLRDRPSHLLIV